MLFEEQRYTAKEVWEMIEEDRESMRGKHTILRFLFADLDEPYYAVAGNKSHVVTRNVHYFGGTQKVVFQVYTRMSYFNAEKNYWKSKLDIINN